MSSRVLGSGMSGKVVSETLPCKKGSPPEGYVTKIMKKSDAEKEYEKVEKLGLERFKEFVIYPEYICEGEKDWHLYSRYGGKSLLEDFDLFESLWKKELTKEQETRLKFIIQKLEELLKNVELMNKENIYHNDISTDNILFDETRMYLIDFEKGSDKSTKHANDIKTMKGIINEFRSFGGLPTEPLSPPRVKLGFSLKKGGRRRRAGSRQSQKTRRVL